jgi:hypothetical protein
MGGNMDKTKALEILSALADGHNPYNGVVFDGDSVFQNPDTVRALHVAIDLIKVKLHNDRKRGSLPANAGKPWTEAETNQLIKEFESNTNLRVIANVHGRTSGAIRSKLIDLGKIQY